MTGGSLLHTVRGPMETPQVWIVAGIEPSRARALVLGDGPRDLRAAAAAGIPMLALRCGGYGERELEGAAGIDDDPAQLLAVLTAERGSRRVAGGDHGELATLP